MNNDKPITSVWKLINPSDDYTLLADRFDVAVVSAALLSVGYGVDELGGEERRGPLFLFGGKPAADSWMVEQTGKTLDAWLEDRDNLAALAACYETYLIGNANLRADFDAAMAAIDDAAKREKFRCDWLDRRRTSMNNIGKRAAEYARGLREKLASDATTKEGGGR